MQTLLPLASSSIGICAQSQANLQAVADCLPPMLRQIQFGMTLARKRGQY